jgi:hypothetical protein
MPDFYTKLLNEGPQQINIGKVTPEMRRDGVAKFRPNCNGKGSTLSGGSSKPVCYIVDKHSPKEVIKSWLSANENLRENLSDWSLHMRISDYGSEWKEASNEILEPGKSRKNNQNGGRPNKSTCPFCGREFTTDLPIHLTECESHA